MEGVMMETIAVGVAYALMGAAGGLIRTVITGKGIIPLPRVEEKVGGSRHLNLGFLAPMAIGALAGYLAPAALGVDSVVSAIAGYAGSDFLENLIERSLKG
jgi:hypothetical protein